MWIDHTKHGRERLRRSEHLPRHVVFVTMGATGGIGRYERLVIEALRDLAENDPLDVQVLQLGASAAPLPGSVRFVTARGSRLRLLGAFAATLLRHRQAAVIFGHVNLTPLRFVPWLLHLPTRYVVLAYGIDVWSPLNTWKRWGLRGASVVLSISSYTTQQLQRVQGVHGSRIRLLPYGYGRDRVSQPPRSPADLVSPRLLTVTRLDASERYKGVDTVLRALPEIVRAYPSLCYTIIGHGSDQDQLRALAEEVGLSANVEFRGFVPDEGLTEAYATCDLFVLPSQKEGLGIVYLEAMAQARPVVAARAGGVPDVVIDGETGVLVDYGDVAGLTTALLTLLADSALRDQLGRAGLARLTRHFSYAQCVERLRDALHLLHTGTCRVTEKGGSRA